MTIKSNQKIGKFLAGALFASTISGTAFGYRTSVYYDHYRMSGERDEYRVRVNISESFSGNDQGKLKDALKVVSEEIEEFFYTERVRNRTSAFRNCLNKYATKDIHPVQYQNSSSTKNLRIDNLMSSMVMLFGIHKDQSFRAMINYFTQPFDNGSITMGNAPVYRTNWPDTRININMNAVAVDHYDTRTVAGTVFHEIMHNLGWRHPTGYPGSFIKEAGLCIVRNNADRPAFGLTGDPGYRIMD